MKRLAALLVLLLAAGLIARFVLGRSRSSEEQLVTVSGEPIRDDALLTDVGDSITPGKE